MTDDYDDIEPNYESKLPRSWTELTLENELQTENMYETIFLKNCFLLWYSTKNDSKNEWMDEYVKGMRLTKPK